MNGPSFDWLNKVSPLLASLPGPNAPVVTIPPQTAPADLGAAATNGGPLPAPDRTRPPNSDFGNALLTALSGKPPATPADAKPPSEADQAALAALSTTPVPGEPRYQAPPQGVPAPQTQIVPASAQQPAEPDVAFRAVGGGATPAREMPIRGPQQNAHLMQSFEAPTAAAGQNDTRNQVVAQHEANVYADQANAALDRQAAIERTMARRQDEMDQAASDYKSAIDQVSKMSLSQDRWWGSKSTPDQIKTGVLIALGGIGSAFNNGNSPADIILKKIDGDLGVQKFDYDVGLERAKGAQNAFGMLMQKYQSEDAATAAARAAAIDYSIAQTNQLAANWKGADSANAAATIIAALEQERQKTIANGLKFVPAGAAAPKYQMVVRGQVLPGLVDEKRAQTIALEHGVKPAEGIDAEMVKGGVQMSIEDRKLQAEARRKADENAVVLPTGETIHPTNPKAAEDARKAVASFDNTKALVTDAKAIRDKATFRVPTSDDRAKLKAIQADLLTEYAVQHNLGALSDHDYAIAKDGTASLFDMGSAVEASLDQVQQRASQRLASQVKLTPGGREAAPKATGTMPASFTAHGKK